ncbi:MAG: hypothetical protein NVSMB47_03710 [Polyangiales bacterium]
MVDQQPTPRIPSHPRFAIVRLLGTGRSGEVWEALDRDRGVRVALKALRAAEPSVLAGLGARLAAFAGLLHPNLVRIEGIHLDREPPFFAMERVEGVDFVSFVRDPRPAPPVTRATLPLAFGQPVQDGGRSAFSPPTPAELARLGVALDGLLAGVGALHRAGKVHHDLHPGNVLVEPSGRAVLLDVDPLADAGGLVAFAAGVPAYMAPEQASGAASAASDLYAVGTMLFEALTGALPFEGDAQTTMLRKQTVGAVRPSFVVDPVPRALDDLCVALLRREPSTRPSAEEARRLARE